MAARQTETTSVRSSVTEEDLEEARQRLLDHMEVDSVNEDPRYDQGHLGNGHIPHSSINPAPHLPPETTLQQPSSNLNHHRQWPPTYGSVATVSLSSQSNYRKPISSKRYRIPFLILLAFDWGLVIFLSVVVMRGDYFNINIHNNYFDLVVVSSFRVVLNVCFYLVLGWVTRLIMGLTTIVPALYLPIKAYYSWSQVGDDVTLNSIAVLTMLLVTFGMPWITAFFFEFKYLPAELARLELPGWRYLDSWLCPQRFVRRERRADTPSLQDVAQHHPIPTRIHRPRESASTMSLDFRTPVGSSRASPTTYDRQCDDELPPIRENDEYSISTSPECDQTMSAVDLRFKQQALAAIESFKTLTQSNDGWVAEKTERELTIYSRVIDGKKVWKADGVIHTSARNLFNILYPGDCTPEWNPQCGLNETVHRVDDSSDVVYTVSNPMGPVSARDFVSIRQMEISGGRFIAASKSIATVMKPEQPGKVRAENGPCGYLVIPLSATECKLIWVLNSNLKGWLPQSVIDQTLATVLTSSMDKLQMYATTRSPPDR